MTQEQIELVKSTWRKVIPIADTAADLFYGKLFELDPSLRSLFASDMTDQKKKLVGMLGNVIASLHRLEVILPSIAGLGRRHVDYGVAEKDYGTMAAALFWTLEQGLGDAWNPEVKAAWTAVYVTLPGAMVEAGQASAG